MADRRLRFRAVALALVVTLVHLVVVGATGIAAGIGRASLLLGAGDDPEIVFAVLEIVFGRDGVAGRLRVAGELRVLVGDVLRRAANFDVWAVGFVRARQRIRTFRPVAAAHPSILVWSHRSSVTLVHANDVLRGARRRSSDALRPNAPGGAARMTAPRSARLPDHPSAPRARAQTPETSRLSGSSAVEPPRSRTRAQVQRYGGSANQAATRDRHRPYSRPS